MPEGPVLTGFWGASPVSPVVGQQVVQQSLVGGLGGSAMVSTGRYLLVLACQFWKRVKQSWAPCCSPTWAGSPYVPGTGEAHGGEPRVALGFPSPWSEAALTPPPLQQWRMRRWPRHRASSLPRQQPSRSSSCSQASTTMSSHCRTSTGPGLHRAAQARPSQQLPYCAGAAKDAPELWQHRHDRGHAAAQPCTLGVLHLPPETAQQTWGQPLCERSLCLLLNGLCR